MTGLRAATPPRHRDGYRAAPGVLLVLREPPAAPPPNPGQPPLVGADPAEGAEVLLALWDDASVTALHGHVDLGTGLRTALAQLVAEELDAPLQSVHVVMGDTASVPNQGATIASASIQVHAAPLRAAAAQARRWLAARRGRPPRPDEHVELRLDLATPLKPAAAHRVVGQAVPRVDISAKLRGGSADDAAPLFVHDQRVPGMLHGRVVRPPYAGADHGDFIGNTLEAVDEASVAHVPGLRAVVVIRDFVGVVAEREEHAEQAARELRVRWKPWPGLPDVADLERALRANPSTPRRLVDEGDVDAALAGLAQPMPRTYVWPYQLHASIGPSCALADYRDAPSGASLHVWAGTQNPHVLRADLGRLLGIAATAVTVERLEAAGCYGRNGADDVAADAALLSRAVGAPVRVQLTREQENAWEPKGAAQLMTVEGGLRADGSVAAYDFATSYPSNGAPTLALLLTRTVEPVAQAFEMGDRTARPPYAYDNLRVTVNDMAPLLRASWLRGVSALPNVFAHESYIDELAAAAGVDPVAFRLRHLPDERAAELVRATAARAGWVPRAAPRRSSAAGDAAVGRGPGNGPAGGAGAGGGAGVGTGGGTGAGPNTSTSTGRGAGLGPGPSTGMGTGIDGNGTGIDVDDGDGDEGDDDGNAAASPLLRGRGFAYARYLHSAWPGYGSAWAAWVADVEVDRRSGEVHVRRVVVGHDAGLLVNPAGVEHQVHGNVIQTTSRALLEQVRPAAATGAAAPAGRPPATTAIDSLEWGAYPILRFSAVPVIDVLHMPRPGEPPLGAGESSSVPGTAAIANAIFDATGVRLRQPPFTPEVVRAALQALPDAGGAAAVAAPLGAGRSGHGMAAGSGDGTNGAGATPTRGHGTSGAGATPASGHGTHGAGAPTAVVDRPHRVGDATGGRGAVGARRRALPAGAPWPPRRSLAKRAAALLLGAAAAAAALLGWRPAIAPVARAAPGAASIYTDAVLERGRQLVAAGNCTGCHTVPGGTVNAGGLPMATPFGTVHSTNITPDVETGIGAWSFSAFQRAMRDGIGRDGRHLYPAFPYTAFAKTTDDDLTAIYAHLMAQPAVRQAPPADTLRFPFNLRPLLAGWNALFHDAAPFAPQPSRSAEWNRGAYLVEGLGHCGGCHTPRNALGAERGGTAHFAGALVDGWEAPALTAASPSPLRWSAGALFDYLRHGHSADHGSAGGPMAAVVRELAALPDADIRAMATYLASFHGGAPEAAAAIADASAAGRSSNRPDGGVPGAAAATGDATAQAGAAVGGTASNAVATPAAAAARSPAATALVAAAAARAAADPALLPDASQRLFDGACGACHHDGDGPTLIGTNTPLALVTALHAARPDNLIRTVLDGVQQPASPRLGFMPAFRHALTDAQVAALAGWMRQRFAPGAPPWTGLRDAVAALRRPPDATR